MPSSPIAAVSDVLNGHAPNTATELVPTTESDRRDLAEALAVLPDPRRRRGVPHSFTPLLAAVTCAMLAGSRSFAAIAEWTTDLPATARVDLGLTGPVPVASTLWHLLTAVDPTALQDVVDAWLRARLLWEANRAQRRRRRGRRVLGVDGKTMRATLRGANPIHLLAVLDHATSIVLAQVNVDVKTNEVRHEAPCHIPGSAGMNSEGGSWARRLTRIRKVKGTRACRDCRRLCPGVGAVRWMSPRDMAKAKLPESQPPVMQLFIHRKQRLKPVPRPVLVYFVGGCTFRAVGDAQ